MLRIASLLMTAGLMASGLAGCSILIDSSEYTGGGGRADGGPGTDSGPGTDGGGTDGDTDGGMTGPCDMDGDGFIDARAECDDMEMMGVPRDCDDSDARRFPGAPPVCSTDGPDHCDVDYGDYPGGSQLDYARWLGSLGFAEAGVLPLHRMGNMPVIDGAPPQISVARFSAEDAMADGIVAFTHINPRQTGDNPQVMIARYGVLGGFEPPVPLRVGDGVVTTPALSFDLLPDASAAAALFGDRVHLLRPVAMSDEMMSLGSSAVSDMDLAWPVGVGIRPAGTGAGPRAVYRQGRLLAVLEDGSTVSAGDAGVVMTRDAVLRTAGALTIAETASGIYVWEGMTSETEHLSDRLLEPRGRPDATQLPDGMAGGRDYMIVGPYADSSGGVTLHSWKIICVGTQRVGGPTPCTIQGPFAIGHTADDDSFVSLSPVPRDATTPLAVAVTDRDVTRPVEEVMLHFLGADGRTVTTGPGGPQAEGTPFSIGLIDGARIGEDFEVTAIDSATVKIPTAGHETIDVMISIAVNRASAGAGQDVLLTGLRFCN